MMKIVFFTISFFLSITTFAQTQYDYYDDDVAHQSHNGNGDFFIGLIVIAVIAFVFLLIRAIINDLVSPKEPRKKNIELNSDEEINPKSHKNASQSELTSDINKEDKVFIPTTIYTLRITYIPYRVKVIQKGDREMNNQLFMKNILSVYYVDSRRNKSIDITNLIGKPKITRIDDAFHCGKYVIPPKQLYYNNQTIYKETTVNIDLNKYRTRKYTNIGDLIPSQEFNPEEFQFAIIDPQQVEGGKVVFAFNYYYYKGIAYWS